MVSDERITAPMRVARARLSRILVAVLFRYKMRLGSTRTDQVKDENPREDNICKYNLHSRQSSSVSSAARRCCLAHSEIPPRLHVDVSGKNRELFL